VTELERAIKLVCVISRPADVSAADFRDWWLEHHANVASRLPGLLRYTISVAEESEDGGPPPWDGVAELWFADRAAMEVAFDSEVGRLCADEDRTAIGGRVAVITREHSIV
jgi:uncharacterized protein (TIGR02118 family)